MYVLIIGANGQLGYDFQRLFRKEKIEFRATTRKDLDITNPEEVNIFFSKNNNFDLIINCAAYNNVDKAEIEKNQCMELNKKAPIRLSKYAKKINAIFVTYSTDFVFDGKKSYPYTEKDSVNPLSVYGKSKYEGEIGVLREYNKVFVIRTSWVYGIANNNFNKQVINWSKNRKKMSIVDDQISVPTYSKDLAYYSWRLFQTQKFGLYHLVNSGIASKYDQAKYVLNKIGWKGILEKVKTEDFNLPAKRAKFSKLSNEKIEKVIKEKIPVWQESIDRFLIELEKTEEN
jgi:dTDP-4-dehydrorhamnose reductase